MATTEHFSLQTARAATISEANGRASIYTSLAVTLAAGAVVGTSALAVHRLHRRRARDAYEPRMIDRFATLVAGAQTCGSDAARTGRDRK
jgi:hypothetical protein